VLAARLVEGELIRVDLGRQLLVVRPASGPPREVDVALHAATLITGSGRSLRMQELKPGQRIAVACEEATAGGCRAQRVRMRPAREAVGPTPAP
jgi:hypothetical protein